MKTVTADAKHNSVGTHHAVPDTDLYHRVFITPTPGITFDKDEKSVEIPDSLSKRYYEEVNLSLSGLRGHVLFFILSFAVFYYMTDGIHHEFDWGIITTVSSLVSLFFGVKIIYEIFWPLKNAYNNLDSNRDDIKDFIRNFKEATWNKDASDDTSEPRILSETGFDIPIPDKMNADPEEQGEQWRDISYDEAYTRFTDVFLQAEAILGKEGMVDLLNEIGYETAY